MPSVAAQDTSTARELLNAVRAAISAPVDDASGVPLEARQPPAGPPRMAPATPLERGSFDREVDGAAEPAFGGFLDGVQESRVVAWLDSGAPVVLGVIGAVVLVRDADRRLVAWKDGARIRRTLLLQLPQYEVCCSWISESHQYPDPPPGTPVRQAHPLLLRLLPLPTRACRRRAGKP